MPLPAILSAIGTIGGAISTGMQVADALGNRGKRKEEKPKMRRLDSGQGGAMKRRQGVEENKMKLEQLKQAAMQLPNVDPQTAQQYGPSILAAIQAQGQQMRG